MLGYFCATHTQGCSDAPGVVGVQRDYFLGRGKNTGPPVQPAAASASAVVRPCVVIVTFLVECVFLPCLLLTFTVGLYALIRFGSIYSIT